MENHGKNVKFYRIMHQVIMVEDGLWYQRDKENHEWVFNQNWMTRYYDAQYDVVEIDYNERDECIEAIRPIPGFSSSEQDDLW